jgi:hypothetical protein
MIISDTKQRIRLSKRSSFSLVIVLLACHLHAQDRAGYDSIAAKYKGQNAVYTNITNRLVISSGSDDTGFVANSYLAMEKLFINGAALNTENYDYCFHSDLHQLTDITAYASIPDGNGYKKIECNNFGSARPKDYVFYDDNRIVVAQYSGLQKNAVTHTKYAINHTDIHMLPTYYLQEDIPVVKATFEVVAPVDVKLNFILKGGNTSCIKQSKEEKNGIVTYRFTATDVPAFREYENVPSFRYYMPHVIPFITSYKSRATNQTVEMLANTDGLYRYDYKFVRYVNMRVDTPIIRTVKELTGNDVSQRDKAAHIYQWVQSNIHYIAFEKGLEGFVPREADTVFKRKYGDCKDMSSMMVAMCRKAGMEAYFCSIGTTELPYTHSETPVEQLYNHMICALKLDGKWVFLDGTDAELPFGANRPDIQGKEAMIYIDAKNYEVVTIPVADADRNVTIDSTFMTMAGSKVSGAAHIRYQGYGAWDVGEYLVKYHKKDERDKAVRFITDRGSNKYIINKYDIVSDVGPNRDLTIKTDFDIDNYAHKIGNKCYVNMNLDPHFADNRINGTEREVACYHNYKKKVKEVVTLAVPKGYRVSYIPKNAEANAPGLWSYKISYKTSAGNITLTKEYELNTLKISAHDFAENNRMADDLQRLYKESVVLTEN